MSKVRVRTRQVLLGRLCLIALWGAVFSGGLPGSLQAATQHVLVVTGIAGEAFYAKRFNSRAEALRDALATGQGVSDSHLVWLRGDGEGSSRATRDNVLTAIAAVANTAAPSDQFALIYIGHASARRQQLKLNLPGPDLRAEELDEALRSLDARPVLLVLAAPASGAFVRALSATRRVVITATSNAAENQQPQFAGPFARTFAQNGTDLDKDKRISVLEAFLRASTEVRRGYERDGLIVVEHALLDDNGDGKGTRLAIGDEILPGADGDVARRFFLDVSRESAADGDAPERLRLRLEARDLVDRIEELKREKTKYFEGDYLARLEDLLVQLALNRRAYRKDLDPGQDGVTTPVRNSRPDEPVDGAGGERS
ncbi:MAG: hypothetical protein AAF458_13110 [Pseudomonadota bacterium]